MSASRSLCRFGIVAALVVAVMPAVVPVVAPPAVALPGECRLETRWQSSGAHYDDVGDGDSVFVETGIKGTSSVVCDVIEDPWNDDDGSAGGGGGGSADGGTSPASVPAPPGPLIPAPPPSVPGAAAPPCVPGANNASDPGRGGDGQTGSGANLLDDLTPLVESGDVTIDRTSHCRIVSIDVNLGPSTGSSDEPNPFEGMTADEAARAMYWPGLYDPTYTEVGARGRIVVQAVKFLFRSTMGDRSAARSFHLIMRNSSPDVRSGVWTMVQERVVSLNAQYKGNIPPNVRRMLEEAVGVLFDLLEQGPISGPGSAPGDYLEVSSESTALGAGATGGSRAYGENKGVCGQIAQASVASTATLLAGGPWARITLRSAAHGTLVDRLKALSPPAAHCPPVHAVVTAGQAALIDVTSGCSAAVTSPRVLTRHEISRLPGSRLSALLNSAASDPTAGSVFQFDRNPWDHAEPWPTPSTTATFADGHVGFTGATGSMSFQAPLSAGGRDDHVVVAATDGAGVEQVFLVTVEIAAQPTCSAADRAVGPAEHDFRAVVQGGRLQVIRNRPFTLDASLFCTADPRHSFRVTVEGSVPGTSSTIRPDGLLDVAWTSPDVVGDEVAVLKVTAWDEVTGTPSAPVAVPVTVRDVAPVCADIDVEYDRTRLAGAPLTIPVSCAMQGGLAVLSAPYLGLQTGTPDPSILSIPAGTFTSTGSTLTFTPAPGAAPAAATAAATPWTVDPRRPTPYRVHGPTFTIHVTLTD